jgi:putative cardiolipin synthase
MAKKKPAFAVTTALPQSEETPLQSLLAGQIKANPGLSGFYVFDKGVESLDARLALIRSAEKTLDLQYYAIHDDLTANLLVEAVIRAAERGVRVRLLVDDISINRRLRLSFSALNAVQNISIRIFNPVTTRDQPFFIRAVAMVRKFDLLTRRMHNKALIADNQFAITGGRNLGDEYFDAHKDRAFKDVDLLCAGPIVNDISGSFDAYWNSGSAYPIAAVYSRISSWEPLAKLRVKLRENWHRHRQNGGGRERLDADFITLTSEKDVRLVWAKAELHADLPQKAEGDRALHFSPLRKLREIASGTEEELLIVSPYFVPGESGLELLSSLKKKGVAVKILTNSLASTDVVAVHTGYRRYRNALLKQGIELYELKRENGKPVRQRPLGRKAPSYASLHAKVYVIDRKQAIIGSFNFDPRSEKLNTEIGIVIDSPQIAALLHAQFEESTDADSSYRLELQSGDVIWKTMEDGKEKRLHLEPGAGFFRRLQARLFALLPFEKQL